MASMRGVLCGCLAWALLLSAAARADEALAKDDPPADSKPAAKKAEDEPRTRWGDRNGLTWIVGRGANRFDVIEWSSRPDLFTLGNLNEWTAKKDYSLDGGLGFDVRWLSGPYREGEEGPHLPPRVYDLYWQGIWRQKWCDYVTSEVCVRPGLYTDFRTTPPDAFRVPGHAAGVFGVDPWLSLVFGVQHLQRDRVKVLPIAGLLWEPSERLQCRLVFPEPKVAYRLGPGGGLLIYGRGEYGGGRWAYKTDAGHSDQLEYSDIRAAVGFEWDGKEGAKLPRFPASTAFMEVGYVFDRHLRFAGGTPEVGPPSGWMLSVGSTW